MSDTGLSLDLVFGTLYLSVILATAFYGIACMQTMSVRYFYYTRYQNDPLSAKILVAGLWVLNTVHEALTISGVYKFIRTGLVTQGSSVDGLPDLVSLILLLCLVGLPTQGFFIYRICVFSGRRIVIPLLWLPLAIYQLVACLIYAGRGIGPNVEGVEPIQSTFTLYNAFEVGIFVSYASVAATIDVFIAIFMTSLLIRERTHAHAFKSTTRLIQRLTVFAVNSGIWTATFAILSAVLLSTFPSELVFTVFLSPLCSLYCNTVLANLNARDYLRNQETTARLHDVCTDMDVFFVSTTSAGLGDGEIDGHDQA